MPIDRRGFLALSGMAALGGCLGSAGSDSRATSSGEATSSEPLDSAVANAPVPDDPSAYQYATMGSGKPSAVTYYGSWKCPYCAEFSQGFLDEIVTDYVEPNGLTLRFRGLAYTGGEPFLGSDAPRATRAGLAVWDLAPKSYWGFHEYVFANQPPESEQWATTDRLVTFAKEAGIERTNELRSRIENGQYEDAVRKTTNAAQQAGIESTPTLVIDGQAVSPLSEQERTRQLLDQVAKG